MNCMRNVTIRPALNGWVCEVGCQTVVFNDLETMLSTLREYILDPAGMEQEYIGRAKNKTMVSIQGTAVEWNPCPVTMEDTTPGSRDTL